MATEFKLSYTANDINTRLGKIDSLAEKSELPTKTSDLTNDSGFVTETYVQEQVESIIIPAPDFAQNDPTSSDYIKNRTHWAEDPVTYTETTLEETTYDGFADGCYNVGGTFNFVDGAECAVTWDGVEYTAVAEQYDLDGLSFIALGNPAILALETDVEDNGQPFGIGYVAEIQTLTLVSNDLEAISHTVKIVSTITTQEIHKLDNKFINSEWMATKELQTIEAVPETTVTFLEENLVDGMGYEHVISSNASSVKHIRKFITAFDGVIYESNCFALGDEFVFGDMSIFGPPIGTDHPYTGIFIPEGIYIFTKTAGDHTIKIDIEYDVYNQLPEGYISDVVDTITSDIKNNISNIETQLNNKQDTITGAASTITSTDLAVDKVLVSDSAGKVGVSEVTSTELGYLSGVTSSVQTQLSTHSDDIAMNNLLASLAKSGSLKWDGVIGNREHVIFSQEGEFNMCLVHVSDECPTYIAPMFQVTVSMAFEGEDAIQGEVQVQEDGLVFSDAFAIIPSDNYTLEEGITFPKKGIYFMALHAAPVGYDYSFTHVSALSIFGHSFAESSGSNYFETKTETNVVELGDTLTWDGDISGREVLDGIFYKVSDATPTIDDFANGCTITMSNGKTFTLPADEIDEIIDNDVFINLEVVCVCNGVDGVSNGIYFANLEDLVEDGAYVTSLTIPNYNFIGEVETNREIIKYEHLPEALQFGEITTTAYGDTLTWDGNTDGLENINGIYYKISDAVPTLDDVRQGFTYTLSTLDNSASETNTVSAEDAASIGMDSDGNIALFYTSGGLPMCTIATSPLTVEGVAYSAGIYVTYSTSYPSSLTINNYSGFPTTTTELVTIDPKYLPEDIGGGSGSGLPEVTTDDNGKTVKVVDGAWSVEQMSYNDLSDKPTLFNGSYNDLSDKPELFSGSYNDLSDKPTLFSGSYNDLSDKPDLDSKSDVGHTHNYAGSNSVGGSAISATKLDTSAGSATQPVYFSDGKPVATTYSLNASVPSNAKFTDTVYTHPYYTQRSLGLYKIAVDNTGHVSRATAVTKSDIVGLGVSVLPSYTSGDEGKFLRIVSGAAAWTTIPNAEDGEF